MSRRPRIQIPGGTYYLLQVSSRHQPLFQEQSDYRMLESLLSNALERAHTDAYAYCWLPHELHLAVRSHDVPISRFMQGFTARHARHLHRRSHDLGPLFVRRFQSLLIDPQVWLPELVRFIHHAPVRAHHAATAADYVHSSHATYLGSRRLAWLNTAPVLRILERRGLSPAAARAFLEAPPTAPEEAALSHDARRPARILGDEAFLQTLPRAQRATRTRTTLSQLVDAIAISQDVSRATLLSRSQRRNASLARSLIAWHATQRRIASLSAVAQYLNRDPSTLSKAIIRHRDKHPHLFRLDALSHLLPLG